MKIKTLCVGPIGTNCYLLCGEKACAVIDPGGDADAVAAAVLETGCTPCAILLTRSCGGCGRKFLSISITGTPAATTHTSPSCFLRSPAPWTTTRGTRSPSAN